MAKRKILFVDDSFEAISQLRRTLLPMKDTWDMSFVSSGAEALIALDEKDIDIVVTDVLMPKMSGLQLLTSVKRFFPGVVRVIFMSSTDSGVADWCKYLAHHSLPKNALLYEFKEVMEEAINNKVKSDSKKLKEKIEQVKDVPANPELYDKVLTILNSPGASVLEVADIILKDMAMTAKVLHMVNSAAFGLKQRVDSPMQAVLFVGVENMKSLILSLKAYSAAEHLDYPDSFVEDLWNHSRLTGTYAKRIVEYMGADREICDVTFSASILHDIGKVILLSHDAEMYTRVIDRVAESHQFFSRTEEELLGISHAEIGSMLLKNWFLSESVVKTVRYHHTPRMCPGEKKFSALTAVHLANVFAAKKIGWN